MPLQARGQATVESILDATSNLIAEIGHEAVNTNLIASAAGVNIATLYQYFSNKQAILLALFERQTNERVETLKKLFGGIGSERPWRETVETALDMVADMRMAQRGAAGIRLAIRASPELMEHDRRANKAAAAVMADSLVRVAGLTKEHATTVAIIGMEIGTSLMDVWSLEYGPGDRSLVDEAKVALVAYLSVYFDRQQQMAS